MTNLEEYKNNKIEEAKKRGQKAVERLDALPGGIAMMAYGFDKEGREKNAEDCKEYLKARRELREAVWEQVKYGNKLAN